MELRSARRHPFLFCFAFWVCAATLPSSSERGPRLISCVFDSRQLDTACPGDEITKLACIWPEKKKRKILPRGLSSTQRTLVSQTQMGLCQVLMAWCLSKLVFSCWVLCLLKSTFASLYFLTLIKRGRGLGGRVTFRLRCLL